MTEAPIQLELTTIIAKEVESVPEGTLINGSFLTPLSFDTIQEYQGVAEASNICVCHIVGEHRICVNPPGVEEVIEEIPHDERAIPLFNHNVSLSYGYLVKDPVVATTLMEEAALTQLSRLENAGVHSVDIDKRLNKMVSQIEDVSGRLNKPGAIKSARHEALRFIKNAEVPTAILASAVIFAANKMGS